MNSNLTEHYNNKNSIKRIHGSYGSLLFDKRWKELRASILSRDHYKCRACNQTDDLQVHHRQYHFSNKLRRFKKPWDYSGNLLLTLCRKCHQKGHQLYQVPIKYI